MANFGLGFETSYKKNNNRTRKVHNGRNPGNVFIGGAADPAAEGGTDVFVVDAVELLVVSGEFHDGLGACRAAAAAVR